MMRSTARVGPYLTPSGVHATGLAVLAVLAGLLPGPASASPTFGNPDVNVSGMCDDLPCFLGDESEVFIAVNPLNPSHQVVVGHAERALMSTFVSTFYSSDRGATWTWRGIHSESGWPDRDWDGLVSGSRFDPSVAFAPDGKVYVAYLATGSPRKIVCVRSSSSGAPPNSGSPAYEQWAHIEGSNCALQDFYHCTDQPRITTGPVAEGSSEYNVYISYTESVDFSIRINLVRSTDLGATFSSPAVVISAPVWEGLPTFSVPAVGPGGEVYVAYMEQANCYPSYIKVTRVDDQGRTVSADVSQELVGTSVVCGLVAGRYPIPAQPDRGILAAPSIAVDHSGLHHGRVYVCYVTAPSYPSPDTDIVMKYSDDRGNTWLPEEGIRVHSPEASSQFHPSLSVDPESGTVLVAWYDGRDDPEDGNANVAVYLATSEDGETWTSDHEHRVSDGLSNVSGGDDNDYGEYIGATAHDGTAYVVWSDNSNRTGLDYYYDFFEFGLPSVGLEVTSFRATSRSGAVLLEWEASVDYGFVGFHLERSLNPEDDYARITSRPISPPAPFRVHDTDVLPGETYYYRLEALDRTAGRNHFGPVAITVPLGPDAVLHPTLGQSFPNPSKGGTITIPFILPEVEAVTIRIFGVSGRQIRWLLEDELGEGYHTAEWDGHDDAGNPVAEGIYLYELATPTYRSSRRLLKLR